MGTDSIFKDSYITVAYDSLSPYGRMVCAYNTEQEAINHIKYQKEKMHSTANWNILHIKDMEWLNPEIE